MFFEHQLPRPWSDGDEHQLFKSALECAEVGERVGIRYVWAQEHHFLEEYSHSTAPEVFLAAVSQRTKVMRLGHGIVLMPPAYNHPARVAERIATLDLVSDGRVEWGTGESSSRLELEGFGVEYIEKRAMWAEALRETAKMLCSEPYPGYEGTHFSMPHRNVVPKPVQRPHPPIWVACTNRDTVRLAARLGIGALTFAFMNASEAKYWVDEYYETFRTECTPIGQDVNPTSRCWPASCATRTGSARSSGDWRASSSSNGRWPTTTASVSTARVAPTSGPSSSGRSGSRWPAPTGSATRSRSAATSGSWRTPVSTS
jgi:hypothetical protein